MGNQAGKERLSKADVEFLKTNTRYDEVSCDWLRWGHVTGGSPLIGQDTIQQWYKGFMKDCPEGKLSPPMFIKIYSKCFPCGNAEEFCTHVFRWAVIGWHGSSDQVLISDWSRTFDSDKNGTIDFKEFLLAIDVTSSGSPEEKLNWAFRWSFIFNTFEAIKHTRLVFNVLWSSSLI